MNKEDIIRMAEEAGIVWDEHTVYGSQENLLVHFAALVAAHEREACARLLDDQWFRTQSDCAAAIRARGNNGT